MYPYSYNGQHGTALIITLILMASLTLIGMSSVNTGVMSLRIARNVEEQYNAFQLAQSAVDFVTSDSANLPVSGTLNSLQTVTLSGSTFTVDTVAGETLIAQAERVLDCGPPPRFSNGTSLLAYSASSFRVYADVDRTATGRGRASLRQGFLSLGPKC